MKCHAGHPELRNFPREFDCIRLVALRINQFQADLRIAICAQENGALINSFTCGDHRVDLLDNETAQQPKYGPTTFVGCSLTLVSLR